MDSQGRSKAPLLGSPVNPGMNLTLVLWLAEIKNLGPVNHDVFTVNLNGYSSKFSRVKLSLLD